MRLGVLGLVNVDVMTLVTEDNGRLAELSVVGQLRLLLTILSLVLRVVWVADALG